MAISELTPTRGERALSIAAAASGGTNPGGLKGLVRGVKDEAEIEAISRALAETNWNRKKAAALLKISYKALLYKIRQYDIHRATPAN
jgi:DNA-binding NtrC family response regulator